MARSVADGQLPDPKLKLDLSNLPVDGFDLSQEPMTQLRFGIIQSIPPGDTLLYRQQQTEALSGVEAMRALEQRLNVIREVRLVYLERFLQAQTLAILQENRAFFSDLLDITERQYAAGRDNQHDVIRSQLELSLIDERILSTGQKRDAAIVALSRYIGIVDAERPIPEVFPQLHHMETKPELEARLQQHPLISIENALMEFNKKRIAEVEETYKPGYTVDITYGHRSGNNLDGSSRPDFLSAMLLVDIPLFTDKRQDKRLAEATKNHLAATFARTDRLYEIRAMAMTQYSDWETLGRRLDLFEQRALAEARDNTESTLNAYQSDVTDFTSLMRAQLTELDTLIETLKVRIDRARAQVNLLYFGGEE
jgi:outer membrane protein TolC